MEFKTGSTIHARFFAVSEGAAARTAIVYRDASGQWTSWSYSELAARAKHVAEALAKIGVVKGDGVGVVTDRSPGTVAALLGVLMVGGRYVPLDPDFPDARLEQMIDDAEISVAVGADRSSTLARNRIAMVDPLNPSAASTTLTNAPTVEAGDDAYVLFTSGSTGRPKGVVVPHRAVLRLVVDADFMSMDDRTRFMWLAPLSFDASTLEIWAPLLNGGTCVVYPDNLSVTADSIGRVIADGDVNSSWLTSSLFNMVIDRHPDALAPLKHLLVGGEALSVPHVHKALQALTGTQLINGYGPTENTTFTCCYPIPRDLDESIERIPIGSAINGTQLRIVDDSLRPVGDGEIGELLALGDGLANGYLGAPGLTAERFPMIDDGAGRSVRAYRTGDRVRLRADGQLDFFGRNDDQVKIEGHRIEPGEIERTLEGFADVRQCRVVARENSNGETRLVAYVLGQGSPAAFREQARRVLPDFMVPHYVFVLDQFPMTGNGKLDLRALPDPFKSEETIVPPTSSVESAWQQVLGTLPDATVNFFDAGGTSLDALRLHDILQLSTKVKLAPTFVFEFPTMDSQKRELAGPSTATDREQRGANRRAAMGRRRRVSR